MLCKEEDSSNTFSAKLDVQGNLFLLESAPVSMSVPCAAEDAESSQEGRWGHGAELEAQIASVDSFVSLYKNILRLIIQLLFSDDKGRSTGLGGTCEML